MVDFAADPIKRPQSAAAQSGKPDYFARGYLEMACGASRMIRTPSGKMQQLEVHPLSSVLEFCREHEGRELKLQVLAWERKEHVDGEQRQLRDGDQMNFDSVESMVKHFGPEAELRAAKRSVSWCYVSWDPMAADHAAKLKSADQMIAGRKAAIAAMEKEIVSPKDITHYDTLRQQIEGNMRALGDQIRAREDLATSVIGPLSDVEWKQWLPANRLHPTAPYVA